VLDFQADPSDARRSALRARASRGSGFTLIETLVVVGITGILIAILLPGLRSARSSAKSLVCSSNMRSAVMEFGEFAAGESPSGQGDSERIGKYRFYVNDAQDQLYGLDEFWDAGSASTVSLSEESSLMVCPAAPGPVTKLRGFPCGAESVQPVENVSLAMNMRLYRASVEYKGVTHLAPAGSTTVHRGILNRPYVPILIDVDGKEAARREKDPFYIAPPLRDVRDAYADGAYWMPSDRHAGQANVAFMGGHVLRSATPADEQWDWSYQAEAGR
jgi:prepilin-type processing-associated H-X9-DG protein/prepilin-type N-terminal cleavage/methylation domain-containing protein